MILGPIYVSVSTHPECILVPWSNICFSLHSPGMYPCSLVQYMFQSPLTRNVSLFLGPIYVSVSTHSECVLVHCSKYVSVSTHSECVLVHWSNICFSLHSPGMCPCSLVQYMFQSPLIRNVSLFLGPIYVSVSTHPECVLVHWSNICFSLHSPGMYDPWSNIGFSLYSPGMYPCSLVQYMFQSPLTRNVSLFLGPIYVSVSTHPECILVPWSNICFSLHSLRNVSLFIGPIYVSVSTHPECVLVHWSNICFSLHSPGMCPCSLVQYMFQSPLTRNVSLFIGPIYVSVSTHSECVLVHWSNICFSLHSPGMCPCSLVQYMFQSPLYPECILVPWPDICFSLHSPGMCPCSLVQYMFQSPLTRNVSLFLGPIYVSVSTHPECILVPWSNICFSLHSPGMYPCSLVQYMFQSPLTRNVSLFIGPIYVSVSTHPECILVPWSDICFSLHSPGMYDPWSNICFSLHSLGMCPCSLVQYMFQSPLTRNVSLFIGPIYVSVSIHPECILVPWPDICFSLHSPGMCPCSLVQYMFQSPLTRNVWSLVQYRFQSLLTRNVSLFLGPIYVSVSTHPECILIAWSNICFSLHSPGMYPCSLVQYMFQSPLIRNVSLFLGPIYVSVSTHSECVLVHWSNICFSLHSPGMCPCSLVQYMFQSPLTRNVSLFIGPIYVSVSIHPECILVPWPDICFSLHSPGMCPCSLVQYMFQSPLTRNVWSLVQYRFQSLLTRNVSLFLGPIYVSVSTHPECILIAWSNICFSLHSPGMYPCSLVQYMFQSPLIRNVSLFLGPIYVSVSTHSECVLVHWSNICFSLHSPGMCPCSMVQYMFQSPLTRNVSLFIGPIYVSVSTHSECVLVHWSNICFSLPSPGMCPCSLVQYMFQSPFIRNVSLFLGPIYVSVSTHPECVLVHWSNICFSLHSLGMCPCSLVQYMFQSPLTRNVSLFIGPIYVSVSTHPECVLVHWSNICFSLHSPGMCPCSLVQYMFQSPFIRNVSLFLGPIYVSVSTHPECVLVHWSNICFSLHSPGMYDPWSNIGFSLYSPGMYPCSLVQYMFQSPLTRNVSLLLGPIYVSVSTHPECILVPWSNICFSLHSSGMYPCSLVQYMFQSPLTRNVSLFIGPIYVSVSIHPECILVPWPDICFSLHSPGMCPCSLVQYMFQSPLTRNVWSLVQYRFQSLLTRNVSLFLGPIYVSVSTHPECILIAWSNICFSLHSPGMYPCSLVQYMFQSPLIRNVSLFLGPIYVSVSTHSECVLVHWSNICFSLHSPGMCPCSLVQYMFQSPLTRNVSLFIGPIYVSVSTHSECVLVHWSNICFSLHSPGMCPCSLVQYMFQSPFIRNVSLFLGPIYVSVSTHPECVLVHWSNICFSLHSPGMYPCSLARYICFSLHSPGMYPCSLVQYMLQSPLTWNVSLFFGPIYVSVSTHPECILVHWSNICFSLHSPGMYPCSLVRYMFQSPLTRNVWSLVQYRFQSPLTRNVSLFIGPIYVSVSTHPECVLVHWSNICFSLHSSGMYPCSLARYMFQSPLTWNVSLFIGPIYVSVSTHPECMILGPI